MEKKKGQKFLSISLICIAIVAIIVAVFCRDADASLYFSTNRVYKETYGGDAYTGIQNAAADTANNIATLNSNLNAAIIFFGEIMSNVFGIVGLLLLCIGIAKAINAFKKEASIIVSNDIQGVQENDKKEN